MKHGKIDYGSCSKKKKKKNNAFVAVGCDFVESLRMVLSGQNECLRDLKYINVVHYLEFMRSSQSV